MAALDDSGATFPDRCQYFTRCALVDCHRVRVRRSKNHPSILRSPDRDAAHVQPSLLRGPRHTRPRVRRTRHQGDAGQRRVLGEATRHGPVLLHSVLAVRDPGPLPLQPRTLLQGELLGLGHHQPLRTAHDLAGRRLVDADHGHRDSARASTRPRVATPSATTPRPAWPSCSTPCRRSCCACCSSTRSASTGRTCPTRHRRASRPGRCSRAPRDSSCPWPP